MSDIKEALIQAQNIEDPPKEVEEKEESSGFVSTLFSIINWIKILAMVGVLF